MSNGKGILDSLSKNDWENIDKKLDQMARFKQPTNKLSYVSDVLNDIKELICVEDGDEVRLEYGRTKATIYIETNYINWYADEGKMGILQNVIGKTDNLTINISGNKIQFTITILDVFEI